LWGLVGTCGDLWGLVGTCGDLWGLVGTGVRVERGMTWTEGL